MLPYSTGPSDQSYSSGHSMVNTLTWGNGSVGKVPVKQAWVLEFGSPSQVNATHSQDLLKAGSSQCAWCRYKIQCGTEHRTAQLSSGSPASLEPCLESLTPLCETALKTSPSSLKWRILRQRAWVWLPHPRLPVHKQKFGGCRPTESNYHSCVVGHSLAGWKGWLSFL